MSETIEAARTTSTILDAVDVSGRMNKFAERVLGSLGRALEAGHLDLLEVRLHDDRTAALRLLGEADYARRLDAIEAGLAIRRVEEAAKGGRGSLVDPAHRFTLVVERHRKLFS